jgi:adenylyltransferase/sulfurtransferase
MMERYQKHILLKEIGKRGQKRLTESSVIIVGCGAIGSVAAINLVRSGIGRVTIVDRDIIDEGNLQRQFLFEEEDIGKEKAVIAEKKLRRMNSLVNVNGIIADVDSSNIKKIVENKDIIIDGTDNMITRFLINDVSVMKKIPWIYCGVIATYGMVKAIIPEKSACFQCMFPSVPLNLPTCNTAGILTSVPSILASIQSTIVIKYIVERTMGKDLIVYDPWYNSFESIKIEKREKCRCCAQKKFDFLKEKEGVVKICGKDALIIPGEKPVSLPSIKKKLEEVGRVEIERTVLKFYKGKYEIHIFESGRAIVYGTDDKSKAQSLYDKYVKI